MNTALLLIACGAAICATSCASKRPVPFRTDADRAFSGRMARFDYANYDRIPNTPTSAVYRFCLKTIPYTRKRAFWGNWGGSGCSGGPPVDAMDDIFRLHDIAYTEVKTLRTMRSADRNCVEALKRLDPKALTPEAREYRDRAISFFSDPLFSLMGKPVLAFVRRAEPADGPLKSEVDVQSLFGLKSADSPMPGQHRPASRTLTVTEKPGSPLKAPQRRNLTVMASISPPRRG
jgi:hypothetical protein